MTKELFRDNSYLRECRAIITQVNGNSVQLNQTVFYPKAGGQPGDTGVIEIDAIDRWKIIDTTNSDGIRHHIDQDFEPAVGSEVKVTLDWDRRYRLMRMHTCLHLLCRAVDGVVTGGQIGDGKARLDFDIPEPTLDKQQIGDQINQWIQEDHPIRSIWIDEDELERRPELVRTMSVAPPRGAGRIRLVEIDDIDLQACGGTHVARTKEIGPIRVSKIEKKGRQNRRVQVVFDPGE